MKVGIAIWFPVFALSTGIIWAVPCFAQGSSDSSIMTTAPASSDMVVPDRPGTTTATTTTTIQNNGSSGKESASEAAHNAEITTERAYNHVTRDVEDISLEARVKAVLHENKFTRDSDVHVTAENGIVTLTGRVSSEENARRVREVVASVYGVKTVNNDLNYLHSSGTITPPDADSTGIAHPAYSDTAPAENVPAR